MSTTMMTVILVILIILLILSIALFFVRRSIMKIEAGITPSMMSLKKELDHIKKDCVYAIYASENTYNSCCDAILEGFVYPIKRLAEIDGTDRPNFSKLLTDGCNQIMEELDYYKSCDTYTANLLKSFINRNQMELQEFSAIQSYFMETFQKDACIDYFITNYSDQCRLATNVSDDCKKLMNNKTKESIIALEKHLLSLKETIEKHISLITKNYDMDELQDMEKDYKSPHKINNKEFYDLCRYLTYKDLSS